MERSIAFGHERLWRGVRASVCARRTVPGRGRRRRRLVGAGARAVRRAPRSALLRQAAAHPGALLRLR